MEKNEFTFKQIAEELTELQAKKNADYDNAYMKDIEKYGMVAALIPLNHKLNRLDNLVTKVEKPMVQAESLEDTFLDLAGYAIMAVQYIRNKKGKKISHAPKED